MKRALILTPTIGLLALGSVGCGSMLWGDTIDPGEVGLLIKLYGNNAGIENAELKAAGQRVTYNSVDTKLITIPTTASTYAFTKSKDEGNPTDESISFNLGGALINMDVGVTYQFSVDPVPGKPEGYTRIHDYYNTYKLTADEFRGTVLRNTIRDCAQTVADDLVKTKKITAVQLLGMTSTFLNGDNGVQSCVAKALPVIRVGNLSSLGSPRLPKNLQDGVNSALEAHQKAEAARAELTQAEADAKVQKTRADAEAYTIKTKAQAASDPNYVKAIQAEAELIKAKAWKGEYAPNIQTQNVQVGGGSKPE